MVLFCFCSCCWVTLAEVCSVLMFRVCFCLTSCSEKTQFSGSVSDNVPLHSHGQEPQTGPDTLKGCWGGSKAETTRASTGMTTAWPGCASSLQTRQRSSSHRPRQPSWISAYGLANYCTLKFMTWYSGKLGSSQRECAFLHCNGASYCRVDTADTSKRLYLYYALLVNSFVGPLMQNG